VASPFKITIVGVGDDGSPGLSQQASEVIARASKVYGSASLLERFADAKVEKQTLGLDLERLATDLDSAPEG